MTKEVFEECEIYKVCCPKCSHVYFRLHWEDKECPKCRNMGENILGVRVAGGHFEVDKTIWDIVEKMDEIKEQEKERFKKNLWAETTKAKRSKTRSSKK